MPQTEDLRILFTGGGTLEREIDRWIVSSNEGAAPVCRGGEGASPTGRRLWVRTRTRLRIPQDELKSVAGLRNVWVSLLNPLSPQSDL